MRTLLATLLVLAGSAALRGQANDFAGLRIFTGTTGAPTPLVCGTPFSCTPHVFTATQGAQVSAVMMGRLNEVYILAASFDTVTNLCIPLGIPALVNHFALTPGTEVVLSVGICTVSDGGRCNGGTNSVLNLFTIPFGLPPGALLFQAVLGAPLSGGGNGLALTTPVWMNY